MEGVALIPRIDQHAAGADPLRDGKIDVRRNRLHKLVAQDGAADILQISGKTTDVVQLDGTQRQAVFQQRHCKAEKLRKGGTRDEAVLLCRIALGILHEFPGSRNPPLCLRTRRDIGVFRLHRAHSRPVARCRRYRVREGALKETRIRHKDACSFGHAFKCIDRLVHIAEKLEHAAQEGAVAVRDRPRFRVFHAWLLLPRSPRLKARINTVEHPLRPGTDLIMPYLRVQEGGNRRLTVVIAVVFPGIAPRILDRVIQEPHPPARSPGQLLHHAVLQKRGLKGAFPVETLVNIGLPAGSGPDLRNVPVHRVQTDQGCLRAHDLPLGIIDQAVCGNIKAEVFSVLYLRVFLHRLAAA